MHRKSSRLIAAGSDRPNRISFYVFNPSGHLGIGSYFQDPVVVGEWPHVVGGADGGDTRIYRNGTLQDRDSYAGQIMPEQGPAPMRVGTRDFHSWFQGAIADIRVRNRALTDDEVGGLHGGTIPPAGLVAEYLFLAAHDSAGGHDGVAVGAMCGTDG